MVSSRLVGAGAFVVLGVVLFTGALFMIGERRNLFEKRFSVYTEFSKLGELEVGAVVRVAGANAGEVTEIRFPKSPAGKFRVKMQVREDLHGLIRTDSIASTQTEGLVGGIFVSIGSGSETLPEVPEDATIPSKEPFSLGDLMQQASDTVTMISDTVQALRGDIEKTVTQLAGTAEDAHAMLIDIRPDVTAMVQNGSRISADAQRVMAGIREGRGTIGKLVNDDTLYLRAREIADQAKGVMDQGKVVMENVRAVTSEMRGAVADFRSKDGPAQGLMADMRVTLGQAREATADLADNMEAMKHNFLLRGYFNQRGYFDLAAISPMEYRKGVLENGKRKAMRIWLAAPILFEPGRDGTEMLTAEGRQRVDSAMAAYLKYLPSSPLVVEGYATDGTASERFRKARIRAGIIREYLLGKYELPAQGVGAIALGDDAVGSPNGGKWEGVALTLFLDREALQFGNQAAR